MLVRVFVGWIAKPFVNRSERTGWQLVLLWLQPRGAPRAKVEQPRADLGAADRRGDPLRARERLSHHARDVARRDAVRHDLERCGSPAIVSIKRLLAPTAKP